MIITRLILCICYYITVFIYTADAFWNLTAQSVKFHSHMGYTFSFLKIGKFLFSTKEETLGNYFLLISLGFSYCSFCMGELCSIVTPFSFMQLYNSKVICTGGVEGLVRNARWLWVAQTLIRCLSPEIITVMRTYRQQLAAAADTGTAIASSSNAAGEGGGEKKKRS